MSEASKPEPIETFNASPAWKFQIYILGGMLFLALVGMGLSQALQQGSWWYWLFVVIVYAALGLWRSTNRARKKDQAIRNMVGRELAHWAILLVFLAIVFVLERQEIISRAASSDIALLLLAISCCLAGVHFDWLLMLVGIFLTVMVIAMATLDQYSIVLWVIMIVMAIGAVAFFYFKSNSGASAAKSID